MTVGCFTSMSLDSPPIGLFPDQSSTRISSIAHAAAFRVNVLASHQHTLCEAFAHRGQNRFLAAPRRPEPTTAPHLVLGRVLELEAAEPQATLRFFPGRLDEPLAASGASSRDGGSVARTQAQQEAG
jgi:Flavin reductase like domain